MKTIFLIGGTGNQLFQLSHLNKNDRYSTFLLNKASRALLKHTDHESIVKPNVSLVDWLLILFSIFDFALLKLIGKTLFTKFDVNACNSTPLYNLIWIGYFQDNVGSSHALLEYFNISPHAIENTLEKKLKTLVVHVRAGDILSLKTQDNPNGILSSDYYLKAFNRLNIAEDLDISIYSDNNIYAETIKTMFESNGIKSQVKDATLDEMLMFSVQSNYFIASNSTLSYWISILRKGNNTVVPKPFIKKKVLPDPFKFNHIDMEL